MKPEESARQDIDRVLQDAGWVVQDRKRLNLGASRGVAVREFSLATGATDYLLFVDRLAVGVIEAKKVGYALTGVEEQSNKYRRGLPDDLPAARLPLPFAFETNSIEHARLGLTTDKLWQAYELLDKTRVRGSRTSGKGSQKTQRMLTDLIVLVRYTMIHDTDATATLEPYSDMVQRRFTDWLAEQERVKKRSFTLEQRQWLDLVRDAIAASVTIEVTNFDSSPFTQKGGLGKAYQVFGPELYPLLDELNERLVA